MSERPSLKIIIKNQDQKALDEWVAGFSREEFVELDVVGQIAMTAMDLGSVFGYKNAIALGYNPTTLFPAARDGQADVVEFLLQYIRPNAETGSSNPLSVAIENKHPTVVDILIAAGAVPNDNDGVVAVSQGDVTLVHKLYFYCGLLPTAQMMELAIKNEDTNMIETILNIYPDIKFSFHGISRDMALYFLKTIPTRDQAMRMLVKHDPRGELLLLVDPRLLEVLVDYTLAYNTREVLVPILLADYRQQSEVSVKLATLAARMNLPNLILGYFRTPDRVDGYDYPIIEAITAENREVLALLLKKTKYTPISLRGMSPVMLAVALNDIESLDILLKGNSSLDAVDGHSPLSVAVAYNSVECARMLMTDDLRSNVVCRGNECVEINKGHEIFIDLQEAKPEIKELF